MRTTETRRQAMIFVCDLLETTWAKFPEMRLCELVEFVAGGVVRTGNSQDISSVSDRDFIDALAEINAGYNTHIKEEFTYEI